jgi:hypothetical protein
MRKGLRRLLGFRLQTTLVILFSLVALLTVGGTALVTSKLIGDYLADAQDKRVSRDMQLAEAFYEIKLEKISTTARRLASSELVINALPEAAGGNPEAMRTLEESVEGEIRSQSLVASHFIVLLDDDGDSILGRTSHVPGEATPAQQGNWYSLPIVAAALDTGDRFAAASPSWTPPGPHPSHSIPGREPRGSR